MWKCGDIEMYFERDGLRDTDASFYKDSKDTYVLLGGYGHHMNPYTHFMNRGYGDEFEEKMAVEAYQWLCRDILRVVGESINEDWDITSEWLVKKREEFNYKIEW